MTTAEKPWNIYYEREVSLRFFFFGKEWTDN